MARFASLSVILVAVVLMWGCGGPQQPGQSVSADLATCLQQYHPVSPDPMPSSGEGARFLRDVTYAVPCEGLAPAGNQAWSILIVAPDDKTVHVYFVGGLIADRCDLLRRVNVTEDASRVTIALAAGADPKIRPGSVCSAVGQSYMTEVTLSDKLGSRTLSGPNNHGEIHHL
jgi:hypothetical protein